MDIRLLIALVGVGGVVAGATLTALVSLFTGWLARRHEHRRWLLDRRLESYLAFNEAVHECSKMDGEPTEDQLKALRAVQVATNKLVLVAPMETANLAAGVLSTATAAVKREKKGLDAKAAWGSLLEQQVDVLIRQRGDVQISRKDRRDIDRQLAEEPPRGAFSED